MPTNLTRADVTRIAALARLELTEDETTLFVEQLAAILSYFEDLQRADTTNVPPTAQVAVLAAAPWREDADRPSLDRDLLIRQAPEGDRDAGLFTVPRVIGS
ncbi:MAG: Asp-tRNA(Asn)/Glu-tRNA(Gln) amidotransferase subunit GatC [Acidobacteria bacterium]|nr:Asp-tRNA(Asn)/Glu-tRNA(Gln) amidotransferase subunit GatC [Acidobacteriota bacterium]